MRCHRDMKSHALSQFNGNNGRIGMDITLNVGHYHWTEVMRGLTENSPITNVQDLYFVRKWRKPAVESDDPQILVKIHIVKVGKVIHKGFKMCISSRSGKLLNPHYEDSPERR